MDANQLKQHNSAYHHKNRFRNAYAFILEDVQCKNSSNQLLSIAEALENPENVGSIHIRF